MTDRPVIVVSYSEVDTYRQCPAKWELGWRERWSAPTTSPALKRGTDFHGIMETHYNAVMEAQRYGTEIAPKALAHAIESQLESCTDEERSLLLWIYTGYVGAYGLDAGWTILAVEYRNTVDLPDLGPDYPLFRLKFKIDLIARDAHGHIWSWDHKTAKNLPKDLEVDLDDQHGLYTWGLRRLGKDVFGSVHNVCRTEKLKTRELEPEERFKRWSTYRSDTELDTIALETVRTMAVAYAWEPGTAPRSPNPSTCAWKCDFLRPCLYGRKGMDLRAMLVDMGYRRQEGRH